jgi:aspartyl protease family protein
MATGFIKRNSRALLAALAAATAPALADDIVLIGAFSDKAAVLGIDGGAPQTVRLGQKLGNLTLLTIERDRAVIEVDGRRRVLLRGQTYSTRAAAAAPSRQSVMMAVGPGGHYTADGQINGGAIRFLVDTGATVVTLPAGEARRLKVDYLAGQRVMTRTAAGDIPAYGIWLDRVRVGAIELHNVEAIVIEKGLEVALLGMSFLNRVDMRREGQSTTLIHRY